ncbi:MAG: CBS domain-containing protein [Acidobacteria bacterium]|nr:CBS domain-containing protein [Acidobacteriota bacterium]
MKKLRSVLEGRTTIYHVQADQTVYAAASWMKENKVGAVPVLRGRQLVGIFTERDLMNRVVVPQKDPHQVRVEDVMTSELVIADAEDSCQTGLAKMQQANCRHLPIVESSTSSSPRLLGLISLRDLMQVEIEEKDEALKIMNAYIHYIPPEVEE